MRWEEESDGAALARDADVTDVAFRLSGRWLPVDHAWALRDAVVKILPWLEDEPGAGIHSIHVAASGNGWERPGLESGGMLSLSRRTPLVLRVPVHRADGTGALGDCRLDVGGCEIVTGAQQRRPLRPARAVFARYVLDDEGDDEERFLERIAAELEARPIVARKLLWRTLAPDRDRKRRTHRPQPADCRSESRRFASDPVPRHRDRAPSRVRAVRSAQGHRSSPRDGPR